MTQDIAPLCDEAQRIKVWPAKRHRQRRLDILRYMLEGFETRRQYTEREVNEILNHRHAFHDPAFLRRELVDRGWLQRTRDCRVYWRPDANDPNACGVK
ncbi:MAG: DUF2087 domain-containing protein [Fimbriimonadaceae bacterium]|nr:DUF2087 domain-containing protein [Fimbriimonadaceae bacterium]